VGYAYISGKNFVVIDILDTGPVLGKVGHMPFPSVIEEGLGFGLFITREIMRSFNGHLEIISKKWRRYDDFSFLADGRGCIK
jgi:C4-dicarboxylate-specific signal transduction histidine kinase